MSCLQTTEKGVLLRVFVQPRASRNQLVGLLDNEMKVRLTSPPVDGAANALCIKYFAKLLGIARSEIELVAGEKSRHKRLLIRHADPAQIARALDRALA